MCKSQKIPRGLETNRLWDCQSSFFAGKRGQLQLGLVLGLGAFGALLGRLRKAAAFPPALTHSSS